MTRDEVVRLLALIDSGEYPAIVTNAQLAALCRTQLAVMDAPEGVVEVMDERTAGYQVDAVACDGIPVGQRVKVVPVEVTS